MDIPGRTSARVALAALTMFAAALLVPSQRRAVSSYVPIEFPKASIGEHAPAAVQDEPEPPSKPKASPTAPAPETPGIAPAARLQRGNFPPAVLALYDEFAKYPWPVPTAMAIASCESGGNALAVSRTADYGVMQIHDGLASYGKAIFDPAFNIRLAYERYYSTRGFSPWSTFNDKCYLRYL